MAGLLYLAGCSSVPVDHVDQAGRARLYESRCDMLRNLDQWSLEGRIALNDGHDGGSGRLNWQRQGEDSKMEFHGALGRGAWRLQSDGSEAILELANGETSRASSVGQLAQQQLGWEIPVDALAWWVRGCAAPGDRDRSILDERGRLMELSQFGWKIDYGKYTEAEGIFMPLKMKAHQDSYMVKLLVRNWSLIADRQADE